MGGLVGVAPLVDGLVVAVHVGRGSGGDVGEVFAGRGEAVGGLVQFDGGDLGGAGVVTGRAGVH